MKSIYLISFVLLLLMNCSKGSGEQEAGNGSESIQVKVAAYNIEVGRSATAEEIGEALKPYDFEIVGVYEAPEGNWSRDVANTLGLEYVVTDRYTTTGHDYKYKSIIIRTPLYGYEEILMTDTLHNAFEPADEGSGNVIDHIMYNPDKIRAVDGNIIEMEEPLSDHKPVWALLQ